MTQEEVFDSFYRATRSDVLLQAFLLTGDLTAATGAVKEAYTIAWHHWPKVTQRRRSGIEQPIQFVRPLAWRLAQRRHTGRIWHRNKGLDDEQKLVLDAVHKLSGTKRRLLLLTEAAGLEPGESARELGITRDVADTRLRRAREDLSASLETTPDQLVHRLRTLEEPARAASLPRTSIVIRAGRERRRLHTVGAVVGAVALTLVVGATTREPGMERASAVHQVLPGGKPVGEKLPEGVKLTAPDQLLQPYQLSELAPDRLWNVTRTDNNTRGTGISTICQQTRFADPRGLAELVRRFEATGRPARDALQTVEISRDVNAAKQTYQTTIGWFAGCQEARLQLMSAYRVEGVGDEAEVLQLQAWRDPRTTYTVGVARVGETTTLLVTTAVAGPPPRPSVLAAALSDAVAKLCPSDRDGCSGRPRMAAEPPPPSGDEPGFLSVVDLPPVGRISKPWVGVRSINAIKRNPAATPCDRALFGRAGARKARSRGFQIPQAKGLPEQFGLVETYGVFPTPKAARAFMSSVRTNVAGCEDRDLAADVSSEHRASRQKDALDLSSWRYTSEVSDKAKLSFRIGFVRVGNRVAEVTFIPSDRDDLTGKQFESLLDRAGQRLGELS